jgi:hypothetical protein
VGILAGNFAGLVPATRGAHIRPLHPRLASLCSSQNVVHEYRGFLSQNGVEKFHWNCEPRHRKGVRRATVKREQMGFMFDHDDLLQEIAQEADRTAA